MYLKDKNILITGAGGGIGSAIALACAREGANLALHCRKITKEIEQLQKEITQYKVSARIIEADLEDDDAVELIYEKFNSIGPYKDQHRAIDVLINNAGFKPIIKEFLYTSTNEWETCMKINTRVPFFLIQRFVTDLILAKGSIINVSSLSGHKPRRHSIPYAMSKASLDIMTQCLAKTYPDIRVNAIAPGYVDTRMVSQETRKKVSAPEIIKPEEVAKCVLWLLSDEGKDINGQIIPFKGKENLDELKTFIII